jgi:phage terminase large subunit GpA-like protein
MRSLRHPLIEGFCGACKPADRRPPWEWCEEHVHVDETSPLPDRWRSDASPWVRAVMDDFANNSVRDIAVQCAAQSAKTQTVMNCACWAMAEDPGPAMWVTATKDVLRQKAKRLLVKPGKKVDCVARLRTLRQDGLSALQRKIERLSITSVVATLPAMALGHESSPDIIGGNLM